MIVTLIVGIGAVLGVLGYVARNKPIDFKIPFVINTKCSSCRVDFIDQCMKCKKLYWPNMSGNTPLLENEVSACMQECYKTNFPFTTGCSNIKSKCEEFGIIGPNEAKDETAGWQTYRNQKYGFEIKYPLDFEGQNPESDTILLEAKKTDRNSLYNLKMHIIPNYKIDQIISEVPEAEETIVGDRSGYKYSYTEGAGVSEVALIQLGQDTLNISFDSIGANPDFVSADEKKIYIQNFFDQILSTLKFIEKNEVKQFDVKKYPWTSIYDMADIGKDFNPCTEEYTERSQSEQVRIKEFYDNLINSDYEVAAAISEDFVGLVSPICSATHTSIAAVPRKNGVILFIYSGNGIPDVSSYGYSFGFLTAFENKIVLSESLINNYYNGPLGAEYEKALAAQDQDFKRISEISNKLEARIKNGMNTGNFENEKIQEEYEQFIGRFN